MPSDGCASSPRKDRLTADVVVNALMSQKDKLAAEYAQLPMTVSQAFTRLSNAFGQWSANSTNRPASPRSSPRR